MQTVDYAAFARLQDEPIRLGRAWLRGTQLVAAINVPAFLGIDIIAPDFVPAVLGPRWHTAVPGLQWLRLAGAAHSFKTLHRSVIKAVGRPPRGLRSTTFAAVTTATTFALRLQWGSLGWQPSSPRRARSR